MGGSFVNLKVVEVKKGNDLKHTSKLCQKYIKRKVEQHVHQMMSWPAQSVDLNPIEIVSVELDGKVKAMQPIRVIQIGGYLCGRKIGRTIVSLW